MIIKHFFQHLHPALRSRSQLKINFLRCDESILIVRLPFNVTWTQLLCFCCKCCLFHFYYHTLAMVLLRVSASSSCLFSTPSIIESSASASSHTFPCGKQASPGRLLKYHLAFPWPHDCVDSRWLSSLLPSGTQVDGGALERLTWISPDYVLFCISPFEPKKATSPRWTSVSRSSVFQESWSQLK